MGPGDAGGHAGRLACRRRARRSRKGQEIADIETSKIANAFESPVTGPLRRRLVGEGETVPVGALLAVVADASVAGRGHRRVRRRVPGELRGRWRPRPSEAAPEPQLVEAGGRRLRYLKLGDADGPPVVFIHGFGGDLNNWLFNQPALAESHTTYALDLPGHGGSTKEVGAGDVGAPDGGGRATSWTRWTSPRRIWSAIRWAAPSASTWRSTIPIASPRSTALCPAGLGPEISMEYIDGFIGDEPGAQAEVGPRDAGLRPGAGHRRHGRGRAQVQAAGRRRRGAEQDRRRDFAGGRQSLQLTPRLGEIKVPVQVIWGREDRIVPVAHAEGLPASVKVTVLDQAGHLVHMEKAGRGQRARSNNIVG